MVVLSFVKYGNIHNALNFTFSIPCDAYLDIFYGLLRTFSSGPLRFCQQKHFSSSTGNHVYILRDGCYSRKLVTSCYDSSQVFSWNYLFLNTGFGQASEH